VLGAGTTYVALTADQLTEDRRDLVLQSVISRIARRASLVSLLHISQHTVRSST